MTSADPAAPAAVPSRLVAAVAVLGAAVLLAGVGLSAKGVATEDLPTHVASADDGTVVVGADGVARPATRGTEVPRGARVRTAEGGSAVLATREREVVLGPATTVVVRDGARQRLEAGALLVRAEDGPGLQVEAPRHATVSVREGAAVRLDLEAPLRVVAYRGAADVGVPDRRARTRVDRLRQVQVSPGALPAQVVPLALRRDDWDRAVVEDVVEDDTDLRRAVQSFLEPDAAPVVASLPATERAPDRAVLTAERTLAYALAHDGGEDFRPDVYRGLLEGRALGGSWGVVAALQGAEPSDADRYVAALLPTGTPVPVLAAGPLDGTDALPSLPGLDPVPAPVEEEPATAPRPRTGPSPRPAPPGGGPVDPAPAPVPTPVREVVDTVLDAVLDVLPEPVATTVPAAVAPLPSPAPTRAPLLDLGVVTVG